MRTATTHEKALLAAADRATHIRVYVDRGAGDWVNLCNVEGQDWVLGAEWGEGVDQPVAEATVTVKRSQDLVSMVPLMTASKLNSVATLLDLGHPIYIETAVVPMDSEPAAGDWKEVFRGKIEELDWNADPITIKCLDQGADLQSAWVETQTKYPVDPATSDDVQDIMQAILTAWGGGVTLYSITGVVATPFQVADSPGWVVTEYVQQKAPVLDAIRALAAMIGWDLRYLWNTADGAFRLTFFEPDRAKVVADYTFDDEDYYEITRMAVNRANIRNVVKVTYMSAANVPTTVIRTNPASIAKYGRRFMEITEASASQIDTPTEANKMGDGAVNDLCEPTAEKSVALPYFWPVMIGDLYAFTANNVHYNSIQTLAVVGFKHSYADHKATTVLECRGKPTAGGMTWLEMEARKGIARPADTFTFDAATGVTLTAGISGLIVTYDDPRGMSPPVDDWAYTICYLSTINGVKGSEYARGKQTRFEVYGLVPDILYYTTLDIVNGKGNVAVSCAQVSLSTNKIGPYYENYDTERMNQVPNGDFGVRTPPATRAVNPPDKWITIVGAFDFPHNCWGAADDVYDSETVHQTGARSILIQPAVGAHFDPGIESSDYFPVQGDTLYEVVFNVYVTNAATSIAAIMYFYTETKVYDSSVALIGVLPVVGAWYRYSSMHLTGAAARFARVGVLQFDATAGATYVDLLGLYRGLPSFLAYFDDGDHVDALASPGVVKNNLESHDHGGNFDTASYSFIAPHDGDYGFKAQVYVTNLPNAKFAYMGIILNGVSFLAISQVEHNATGGAIEICMNASIESCVLSEGDSVEVVLYHNTGGTLSVLGPAAYTNFSGKQNK